MINNNSTSTFLNLSELFLSKIVLPSTVVVISLKSKENNSACVCSAKCLTSSRIIVDDFSMDNSRMTTSAPAGENKMRRKSNKNNWSVNSVSSTEFHHHGSQVAIAKNQSADSEYKLNECVASANKIAPLTTSKQRWGYENHSISALMGKFGRIKMILGRNPNLTELVDVAGLTMEEIDLIELTDWICESDDLEEWEPSTRMTSERPQIGEIKNGEQV